MKKTLTAIALFAAVAVSATTVSANPHVGHKERLQSYYYYFGAPCCNKIAAAAPCGVAAAPACGECCAPQVAYVEMEQVCRTSSCNPCDNGFNILNPFSYFG